MRTVELSAGFEPRSAKSLLPLTLPPGQSIALTCVEPKEKKEKTQKNLLKFYLKTEFQAARLEESSFENVSWKISGIPRRCRFFPGRRRTCKEGSQHTPRSGSACLGRKALCRVRMLKKMIIGIFH